MIADWTPSPSRAVPLTVNVSPPFAVVGEGEALTSSGRVDQVLVSGEKHPALCAIVAAVALSLHDTAVTASARHRNAA